MAFLHFVPLICQLSVTAFYFYRSSQVNKQKRNLDELEIALVGYFHSLQSYANSMRLTGMAVNDPPKRVAPTPTQLTDAVADLKKIAEAG